MISLPNPSIKMTNTSELQEFLYDSCRQNPDLLEHIISEYISLLDKSQLLDLEDFLVNNFGDD